MDDNGLSRLVLDIIGDDIADLTDEQIANLTTSQIIDLIIKNGGEQDFITQINAVEIRATASTITKEDLQRDGLLLDPNELPTLKQLNARLSQLVQSQGEWAGAPSVIDHHPLILEPRYPHQRLNGQTWQSLAGEPNDSPLGMFYIIWSNHPKCQDNHTIINYWYNHAHNTEIYICGEPWPKDKTGKSITNVPTVRYPIIVRSSCADKIDFMLSTMMASKAWTAEAEYNALQKLKSLVPEHIFCSYLTTGTFIETSKRSKIIYMFRRARPTITMSANSGTMKVLTALCAHPIGYYQGTFAGTMVPTDDVIAHLLMMRADEHGLWKKCQHHPIHDHLAGI